MVTPSITVVVPTVGRPRDLVACLNSLALVAYDSWDVLVIDQSHGTETADFVRTVDVLSDRLTYVRMEERGLSRARNLAVHIGRADILAFLDDDCTVDPDWLAHVAGAFHRHPAAAVIFGTVENALHDPDSFVPSYVVPEERCFRDKRDILTIHGMGAGMYLRTGVCRGVGPFDVFAGAGAFFGAGEETDFVYRALTQGCVLVETPAIVVKHHGARSHAQGEARDLVRKYNYSQGALDMKYLRCGDVAALTIVACRLAERIAVVNFRRIVFGGGPTYLASLAAYVLGFVQSLRVPVLRRGTLWGHPDDYREPDTLSAKSFHVGQGIANPSTSVDSID